MSSASPSKVQGHIAASVAPRNREKRRLAARRQMLHKQRQAVPQELLITSCTVRRAELALWRCRSSSCHCLVRPEAESSTQASCRCRRASPVSSGPTEPCRTGGGGGLRTATLPAVVDPGQLANACSILRAYSPLQGTAGRVLGISTFRASTDQGWLAWQVGRCNLLRPQCFLQTGGKGC